jgi:hypothetical protein
LSFYSFRRAWKKHY